MSRLRASSSWQCCSRCSAVSMSALHGHISGSPILNSLYMWALSLLCPVLSLNRITCSGLFSLWGLSDWSEFGCCRFLLFLGEGFDDGLFIGVRGVSVLLVQLASFPSKLVYLFISLDPAVFWNPLQGYVCLGCEVDQGSFHLVEILLTGVLEFVEDRESICEDDHIGFGWGYVIYMNRTWIWVIGDRLADFLREKEVVRGHYAHAFQPTLIMFNKLTGTINCTIYLIFNDSDFARGSQGLRKAKPAGVNFSYTFQMIRVKIYAEMKQFMLDALNFLRMRFTR